MIMISQTLRDARRYEDAMAQNITPLERPEFHLSPKVGWMNDPNGFSYYKDKFHLFYQYYPYDSQWGPMHWGHAVSDDLLHWEYLPAAIAPDMPYDYVGCFSGSAITLPDGKQLFMYTSVRKEAQPDGGVRDIQTQSLAVGDGMDYEKDVRNPILTAEDMPENSSPFDFRDPKMWKCEDGTYRCVIVNDRADGTGGHILLYRSEDGFNWEFESVMLSNDGRFGKMWECPDFFSLEGQEVLSVSPQGLTREEFRFQNIYQSGYFILKDGKPEEKDFREWDYGFDFYAPQTFQDGKGRRILIGWMGMPDADEEYVNPTAQSEGWQHCLTVPREVTYKNGMLYQYPVKELNGLRENGTSISGSSVELPVNGPFDLDIQVKGDQGKVSLGENLFLEYQGGDVILTLSETAGAGRKVRKAHVPSGKVESLRILADTTAVEIYVNGGEVVFSTRYYPETQAQAVKVEAADVDGKIYGLKNYVME